MFRAIGFKRLDITQIYVLYAMMLGILTIACSLSIGIFVAAIIHNASWLDMTVRSQLAFGVDDAKLAFSLFGWGPMVLWPCAAIIVAGLIGMVFPLLRNIRRNPIRDMRDE